MIDNSKIIKKIGNMVLPIVMILIVLNLITNMVNENKSEIGSLFGYRPVVVVSGSMLPDIQINSVSIMKYCGIEDIDIGDVAVYRHPSLGITITHRVIDKDTNIKGETYVLTKGDANNSADNIEIKDSMVVGKLTKTFNWIAPYISLIMLEGGKLNIVTFLPILLILSVTLTFIGMVLNSIFMLIKLSYITVFKPDKLQGIYDTYVSNNGIQKDNMYVYKDLKRNKEDTIKVFICKVLLAKDTKAFEESSIYLQKSQDRLKNIIDKSENKENAEKRVK